MPTPAINERVAKEVKMTWIGLTLPVEPEAAFFFALLVLEDEEEEDEPDFEEDPDLVVEPVLEEPLTVVEPLELPVKVTEAEAVPVPKEPISLKTVLQES